MNKKLNNRELRALKAEKSAKTEIAKNQQLANSMADLLYKYMRHIFHITGKFHYDNDNFQSHEKDFLKKIETEITR